MDSTAEGARSIHFRADGFECTGDCDVRCKEKGGDELRRLMRRINDQRMMVGAGVGLGVSGGGIGVLGVLGVCLVCLVCAWWWCWRRRPWLQMNVLS